MASTVSAFLMATVFREVAALARAITAALVSGVMPPNGEIVSALFSKTRSVHFVHSGGLLGQERLGPDRFKNGFGFLREQRLATDATERECFGA